MKGNKVWYDNEKDMATKQWFNLIWFTIFMVSLIFGVKHIAYFNDWEGYVVSIFSVLMLFLQQIWQWEMINVFKGRSKNKK